MWLVRVVAVTRCNASANSARRRARPIIGAATASSLSTSSSASDAMLKFHALRVAHVQPQAEDAIALALEVPQELAGEYRGAAGQHIVVRASLEGQEVRRTYSLVSAPGERLLRIVARVHAEGRLSRFLAQHVRAGDRLEVLPPNGSFT